MQPKLNNLTPETANTPHQVSGGKQLQLSSVKIQSTFASLQSHVKNNSESHKHDFSTLKADESRKRKVLTSQLENESSDSSIKK